MTEEMDFCKKTHYHGYQVVLEVAQLLMTNSQKASQTNLLKVSPEARGWKCIQIQEFLW